MTGDDLLNVRDHVNAFATLIASKRIQPPLSVGLFGDWGSGKSFFMEKMRQKIAEHAARANARSDSVFHKRIVQINFNAWHYVEANLWASLVEHLFRNLKLTYEDDRDASINDRREELLRTLDSLMTERVEAEEKVQKAELARDRAAQELEAQKKAADASAALVTGMRATDVWELVNIETQIRTELQDQLNELGGGRILQSNEDVRKTVDELRTVGTRTNLLASWVTRQPRALVWLVVLIVLAPFGAQALIAIVKSTGPDWIKPLSEGVVQITTLVGAVVGWLAKRLKSGKAILDKLDNARSKVDARIAAAEVARQNKINDADDKLVAASNDVAASKQTVQTTEQAVLEAKQHLLELTTGYRLTRFIDERAASDDYRKLLGVLATVRQDFSKLSALMHEPPETSVVSDNARIDRIVLYIDDLDRCPPNVVVDVLQAVHLLLAFKLFVVVVGVDARWISESLEQKHRALRTKSQEEGGRAVFEESGLIGYEVKPHDYLEKIFQVPFWLDKLESKTTSRYIGNLLAEDVFRAATPAAPINVAAAMDGGIAGNTPGVQTRRLHYTLGEGEAPEADPKQLTIDQKELTHMTSAELAQLVGRSPRTAKRFVNTYRFFRASVAPERLDGYLHEARPPEYKCALLLLAIVVGAPNISPDVFALMKNGDSKLSVRDFGKALSPTGRYTDQWTAVAAALSKFDEGAKLEHLTLHIARVSPYSFRAPYESRKSNKLSPQSDHIPIAKARKPRVSTRR